MTEPVTGPAEGVARALGHAFRDPALLVRALTHRSAGAANYERLEFLGDGLINFVIGEALYRTCPDAPEGDLSRMRASLVRESSLARIAEGLDLSGALIMGPGELRSGGFRRRSILADTVEALVGAVLLDGGYPAARDCCLRLFAGGLRELPDAEDLKDAKTRLQERLQGAGLPLPEYALLSEDGPPHARHFTVACRLMDRDLETRGAASSRKDAEQQAASRMLAELDGVRA